VSGNVLHLGLCQRHGNLSTSNRQRTLVTETGEGSITFNMMCDELCPPSDASRLPGKPAVSQFEQMSISIVVQSTQWNRGPTMSCWQLHPHQKDDTEVLGKGHSLEALDTGVLDYRKESMGVKGRKGMYCRHLRGSSELSNVLAPSSFDLSERLFDRQGGFTRKGWIGWTLCTSLGPTLPHEKANTYLKK
jgi:hypothetical protein